MNELILTGRGYISNEAVNAKYNYTAGEIDLLVKIITVLRRAKNDADRFTLKFSYSQLAPAESSGRGYEYIRKHCRGLLAKPLEIYLTEKNSYYMSAVISEVTIPKKHDSLITMRVNPTMCELLTDTARSYTSFEIYSLLCLQTKHAKRLYLMCSQFKNTGVKYINLDELKKLLGVSDAYDKNGDFIRRVVIPATAEISKKTELKTTFTTVKTGRSIDQICIKIELSEQAATLEGNKSQIEYMIRCGLSDWQIENVLDTLTVQEIHPILYYMKLHYNTIKNKGAYLVKMFEDNGVYMAKRINQQLSIQYENNNTQPGRPNRA